MKLLASTHRGLVSSLQMQILSLSNWLIFVKQGLVMQVTFLSAALFLFFVPYITMTTIV